MNIEQWNNNEFTNTEEFETFASDLTTDLKEKLEAEGLKLLKTLPNPYLFGAIAITIEGNKWLHITLPDVRDEKDWAHHVCLRRMSSERDWKGDAFHYCSWNEVGAQAAKYMADEYDSETL